MFSRRYLLLIPASLTLLGAGGQAWKDKAVADWSDDDTRQVLTDSPWAKTVQSSIDPSGRNGQRSRGMGRGGGISLGGIGIGLPGMGRGGGGYPGGGYPGGGGYPQGGGGGGPVDAGDAPQVRLRWESAMPVRAAEMKAHETNAPSVDDAHYAIAVYGVPQRMLSGGIEAQLKKQAAIKRTGKSDLRPSSVDVLQREEGPVVVYLFPRLKEITRQDSRIEFDASIARLRVSQAFYVDEMVYQGKVEM